MREYVPRIANGNKWKQFDLIKVLYALFSKCKKLKAKNIFMIFALTEIDTFFQNH